MHADTRWRSPSMMHTSARDEQACTGTHVACKQSGGESEREKERSNRMMQCMYRANVKQSRSVSGCLAFAAIHLIPLLIASRSLFVTQTVTRVVPCFSCLDRSSQEALFVNTCVSVVLFTVAMHGRKDVMLWCQGHENLVANKRRHGVWKVRAVSRQQR